MSERVTLVILDHTVPGSERRWWSRRRGTFGRIGDCVVSVGEVDDGRWWVRRIAHPITGPFRAELYAGEDEAMAVARAVMAEAEPLLIEGGYRPFRPG